MAPLNALEERLAAALARIDVVAEHEAGNLARALAAAMTPCYLCGGRGTIRDYNGGGELATFTCDNCLGAGVESA